MYPGQRLTLIIECYSIRGSVGSMLNPPVTPLVWFGNIRINIPANRSSATLQGLSSEDWYYDGGIDTDTQYSNLTTYPASNRRRNFYQSENLTRGATGINNNASNCVTTTKQLDMIWDGTVTKTWGSTFNFGSMVPGNISNTAKPIRGQCIHKQAGEY